MDRNETGHPQPKGALIRAILHLSSYKEEKVLKSLRKSKWGEKERREDIDSERQAI